MNSNNVVNDKSNQNLRLAKEWMDACVKSDLDKMGSIMNPGAIVYGLGGSDSMTFSEYIDKLKRRKERGTFSISNEQWLPIAMDGSVFSGEGIMFWGVQILNYNNGISVSLPNHIVFIIDNDKIESLYFYYDQLKLAKERGYTLTRQENNNLVEK